MGERDRDMATGDYVMDSTGKPVETEGLGPAVRARLRGHRLGWMHAPDDHWGSDFHKYKKKDSTKLTDLLGESMATSALQPLVDNGRADNLEVETQFAQRGGTAIHVALLDRRQQNELTVTTPIGR